MAAGRPQLVQYVAEFRPKMKLLGIYVVATKAFICRISECCASLFKALSS